MATEKIAIVGPRGSGKTVLLAVLAHRLQQKTEKGFSMRPDNPEAIRFSHEKWKALQKGEWPAPTPPAEKPPVYRWTLCKDSKENQLVTSDIAGEAWQKFIDEKRAAHFDEQELPHWEKFKKHCEELPKKFSQNVIANHVTSVENLLKNASGVFLVLDLGQIIDEAPDYELAMHLPGALVQHMKHIGRKHIPITLVLSKAHEYEYLLKEKGDWQKVVKSCIPWMPPFEKIIPVSAVAKVETIQGGENKKSRPAKNFPSEGLEDLCEDIWTTMEGAWLRRLIQTLKWFCLIDLPLVLLAYLVDLWMFYVSTSPIPCICWISFALLSWCGIRFYMYMRKSK